MGLSYRLLCYSVTSVSSSHSYLSAFVWLWDNCYLRITKFYFLLHPLYNRTLCFWDHKISEITSNAQNTQTLVYSLSYSAFWKGTKTLCVLLNHSKAGQQIQLTSLKYINTIARNRQETAAFNASIKTTMEWAIKEKFLPFQFRYFDP